MEPIRFGTVENSSGQLEFCYEDEEGCETRELWVYYNPFGDYEICDPTRHDIDECWQETLPVHSRFGYFRTERYTYDRETGTSLSGREQLINRWNIWEKSFDDSGDSIPYEDRKIKPIVYHMNVMFPLDLHAVHKILLMIWYQRKIF